MISAISMQTPVLVMGWNHKYEEVLKEFDLGNFTISEEDFDYEKILSSFKLLVKNKPTVRKKIEEGLQKSHQSSNKQLEYILDNFSKP